MRTMPIVGVLWACAALQACDCAAGAPSTTLPSTTLPSTTLPSTTPTTTAATSAPTTPPIDPLAPRSPRAAESAIPSARRGLDDAQRAEVIRA
ncbi:MAG: hypothetical protein M3Y87_25240, partial [Myxococcota bacterium]|nr:hypothetical protein [Myxococcota bacterium]